jgi:hypothetical protein
VEGFAPTRFGRQLYARGAFANFADQFMAEGDTRLSVANKGRKPIAKGFTLTDSMVQDFRAMLKNQRITVDEEAFQTDLHFVRAMMRYEIDLALFGVEEARRNLIQQDPQATFAISQFGEAQRLADMSRSTPRAGGK